MLDHLESNYDCANASADLNGLLEELKALKGDGEPTKETEMHINRIENQISFIENKCSIRPQHEL
jgi:hypothetical protein